MLWRIITFELACKAMKYVLEQEGFSQSKTGSSKLILETEYSRGLIKDSAEWLKMLRLRNDETHQYNKEAAIELCKAIPEFIKKYF